MMEAQRPRLAHGSYTSAFFGGVLGALILTLGGVVGRSLGWTRMDPEMGLGSLITSTVGPGVWLFGWLLHLFNGGIFGLLYAVGFRTLGISGAVTGVAFGFLHFVVAGIFLGIVPMVHPFIPESAPAPGWFALGAGPGTFILVLLAHLLFGTVVGGIYYRSAKRHATRLPSDDVQSWAA